MKKSILLIFGILALLIFWSFGLFPLILISLIVAATITVSYHGNSIFLGRSLKWWALVFILAPSPLFMCFDGCLGPSVVLPWIIGWIPIFTLFSLFFYTTWLWHLVFFAPFAGGMILTEKLFGRDMQNRVWVKDTPLILYFIAYSILVFSLWYLIPESTTQFLLQQTH